MIRASVLQPHPSCVLEDWLHDISRDSTNFEIDQNLKKCSEMRDCSKSLNKSQIIFATFLGQSISGMTGKFKPLKLLVAVINFFFLR